jgi:hypothetical protein
MGRLYLLVIDHTASFLKKGGLMRPSEFEHISAAVALSMDEVSRRLRVSGPQTGQHRFPLRLRSGRYK